MNKRRVSKDEIKKASEVDLVTYAESKGEVFVKQGDYHRHSEHDSLLVTDNKWFWNSKQVGAYGAISFAMEFYNYNFPEAVKDINNQNIQSVKRESYTEYRKKNFKYPHEYESSSVENAKSYLINERSLSPVIVDWLVEKDLIAEDRLKNIVFKWREDGGKGKIVGADRHGTVPMENGRLFKQVVANSDEKRGFQIDIGTPKHIAVFESPIDMLSYWQMKIKSLKDVRLLSMSGLKNTTFMNSVMDLERQGYNLEKITIAVDNDLAGKSFTKRLEDAYDFRDGFLVKDIPLNKDWNEDLKKANKRDQKQQRNLGDVMSM